VLLLHWRSSVTACAAAAAEALSCIKRQSQLCYLLVVRAHISIKTHNLYKLHQGSWSLFVVLLVYPMRLRMLRLWQSRSCCGPYSVWWLYSIAPRSCCSPYSVCSAYIAFANSKLAN
jgi:hypothetical protein